MPHEPGHTEEHHDKGEHRALLPEDAPTWQIDIAEGCEVFTADGDKLGTVKEVQGGYFKLNVSLHPDYWLQRQFVTSNDGGRITMSFTKDQADDYKVKFLPEDAVLQGQDARFDAKHDADAIGFETERVGGPVTNPESTPTNPASETIAAAERQYDRDHRP
jgi:hypothetical protein